ncbi:hypothetical protein FA15DRAFT_188496 [Coprinopsis marcescibilis]|uniref:TPR-like protein n=1 Tax=Coprinopsis marcescibilis TaxID=230819 RepID=A0A5C3LA61_COPMA|nr:hypothetical protein FA15DRAFT_188496 [Coprinopsis marcescibilis]
MLSKRTHSLASRFSASSSTVRPRLQRSFSTKPPESSGNAGVIQETISGHAATAIQATGRFFKFSAIGLLALGITVYTGYEATHQYVEHVALKPETDDEVRKFQWDMSEENWNGDPLVGGTDPGLGYIGRHALRAAWMARNWGIGPPELHATKLGQPEETGVDMQLTQTLGYLKIALVAAKSRASTSNVHPLTSPELSNRYASLLERLGSKYLLTSLEYFQQAWEGYSGQGLPSARIASKMGDISSRLHDDQKARQWWKTAIKLCQGRPEIGPLLQPTHLPASPWAQRIIASTLVSVSVHYAQSGKLSEAEAFEEASLNFLRSIPTPQSLATASPPQALHSLFILQRSSLLSIHLAEVLHAQKRSPIASIQWLASAAESSERVARALSGLSLQASPDTPIQLQIPSDNDKILSVYKSSRCMSDVASRLYRDARRTSAEAWNLLGVLYEKRDGPTSKDALRCYDRAVRWAGKLDEANEFTTEADWNTFLSNLQRAQRASGQVQDS